MKKIKKIKFVLLALLIAALFTNVHAKGSNDARWIWQQEEGQPNTWVAFRKTLTLDEVPQEALAKISVDTKYWLWINGEMVLFEGGLYRGAGPNTIYYDEVDFAPYLKNGENTIAILVWYVGRTCKAHESSGQGGLYVAADGLPELNSDASWKMKVHAAYDPQSGGGGRGPNTLAAYNIKFDARKSMGDWSEKAWYTSHYDDSEWKTPVEKGMANSLPWGDFVKRPIPQWNDRGLVNYKSLTLNGVSVQLPYTNKSDSTVVIKATLPFNQQITPYVGVNSKAGKTIKMDVDNRYNKIKATYITKNGPQQFESFAWMNGHNVIYKVPPGVKVNELKYRWTGVGDMPGTFECSDEFYSHLWWLARNSLYICARENYMDCPDRERGLWIGDVADQTGAIFYTLDEGGRLLLKKAIDNTIAYRGSDTIRGLAPGFRGDGGSASELTAQSLQFIAQGIWPYYFNTGDTATLANAYPAVLNYLKLWSMKDNGMPEHRKGFANWVDWGVDSDPFVVNVEMYYLALKAAKKMALELGQPEDTAWYNNRIKSIQKNFDKVYWRGTHYGRPNQPLEERASAIAIIAGLANKDCYNTMVDKVLLPVQKASPHIEWMVEEALFLAGEGDKALLRMKQRHGWQIEEKPNITTLYERFPNDARGNLGTYNHAWNSPNYVLSRYIAGIYATQVAWSEFVVKPNLVNLTHVKQIVPSVKGDISLKVNISDKSYTTELISPEHTQAKVYLPKGTKPVAEVLINGKALYKNGKFNAKVFKVYKAEEDNNYFKIKLNAGTWKCEVVYQ